MPGGLPILEDFNHDQLLLGTMIAQAVFIFSYLITSFVLITNAYAGFNGTLLGFVYAAVLVLSYVKLYKDSNRLMFGIVLGMVFILTFVSLQSAIFWGQYSGCTSYLDINYSTGNDTGTVQCNSRAAMASMCTFSVFMFLSYLFQIVVMIKFKNEILGSDPSTHSSHTDGAAAGHRGVYSAVPPSNYPGQASNPMMNNAK